MSSPTNTTSIKKTPINRLQVAAVAVALALGSAAACAQQQVKQDEPNRGGARMQQLDVNKDGLIDRAEAAKAPRLAERFDQLDTNKDGKLSADERAQMRGKRRGGVERSGSGERSGGAG